jgi:hypothetical protein
LFAEIGGRLLHTATVTTQPFTGLTFFARLPLLAGGAVFTSLALFTRGTVVALAAIFAGLAVVAGIAILALGALLAVLALAIVAIATVVTLVAAIVAGLVFVEIEILVVRTVELVTGATLFLDTRAAGFEHAEIMVGELEIIFGVHPVAGALGVGGEVLIFLQQLRGVAAGAIVDAIAVVTRVAAAASRLTLATATATAAGLTIVHQGLVVLSLPVRRSTDRGCEQIRKAMHGHRPPAMTTGRQWRT